MREGKTLKEGRKDRLMEDKKKGRKEDWGRKTKCI